MLKHRKGEIIVIGKGKSYNQGNVLQNELRGEGLAQIVHACTPNAERGRNFGVHIRQINTIISIRDTGCHFPSPSSVFVVIFGDAIAPDMSRCALPDRLGSNFAITNIQLQCPENIP
jgi:hypothetical protein